LARTGQNVSDPTSAFRLPLPPGTGHSDLITYRSVHFFGENLSNPLGEAARYVRQLEQIRERSPHILCVHPEFSAEDEGSDLAWRVTVIFSELPTDLSE
jgi:hypothetical protein